jgi:hypothetical protein
MDCTAPVRQLLKESGVHDYEIQEQGPANRHIVQADFVYDGMVIETQA